MPPPPHPPPQKENTFCDSSPTPIGQISNVLRNETTTTHGKVYKNKTISSFRARDCVRDEAMKRCHISERVLRFGARAFVSIANTPFRICVKPLFQGETKCQAIDENDFLCSCK